MRNKALILTAAALLVFSFGCLTLAQEEAQGAQNIGMVYRFTVEPGMFQQFEAAIHAHLAWCEAQNEPWAWTAYQVITGDNYGQYLFRADVSSWEEIDAYEEFFSRKVMNFRLNVTPLLESISVSIWETEIELSRWPEDGDFNLLEVYKYSIKPTHVREFNEAIGRIHEAIVETDWPVFYLWESLRSGGIVPSAKLVIPYESWAGFSEPETSLWEILVAAYGEEEAGSILEQWSNSVCKTESFTVRYRPDLSYSPEE